VEQGAVYVSGARYYENQSLYVGLAVLFLANVAGLQVIQYELMVHMDVFYLQILFFTWLKGKCSPKRTPLLSLMTVFGSCYDTCEFCLLLSAGG